MFHLDHVGEYMATRMYMRTMALAGESRLDYTTYTPRKIYTH